MAEATPFLSVSGQQSSDGVGHRGEGVGQTTTEGGDCRDDHDCDRSGDQAVLHATKACELTHWKDDLCLSTLAAAHAEAGDFDAAIKWQLQAIELAPDEAKEDYRFCLDHMKKGEPCRDVPLETEASGNLD